MNVEKLRAFFKKPIGRKIQLFFDGSGYLERRRSYSRLYEQYNEQGDRRFTFHEYGGREFRGYWYREVGMQVKAEEMHTGWASLLSVQETKAPDGTLAYHVSLDAILPTHPTYLFQKASYSQNENGVLRKREEYSGGGRVFIGYDKRRKIEIGREVDLTKQLPSLRLKALENGHLSINQLPLQINVQETIKQFMQQLRDNNFASPQLIE